MNTAAAVCVRWRGRIVHTYKRTLHTCMHEGSSFMLIAPERTSTEHTTTNKGEDMHILNTYTQAHTRIQTRTLRWRLCTIAEKDLSRIYRFIQTKHPFQVHVEAYETHVVTYTRMCIHRHEYKHKHFL